MKALRRIPGFLSTLQATARRRNVLPRFLTYVVTYRCNARCIMCDSWKMEGHDDLTLPEIERIFAQLPRMDAVRLTGGEPFVRKDLLDIAHLAQRHLQPFFLHITSNGFLTDRIVTFCEQRDRSIPLSLLISLDGVGEKHNQVRGRDTAWDSAMKTIRALAPRREELRLTIGVNQTIVDAEGARHYRLLRDELAPLGVHHHMVMAYDVSATYSLERERDVAPEGIGQFTTFGTFTDDELRDLFAEVERDIDRLPLSHRVAKRYYLRGIASRLLRRGGAPNPRCVALNAHMRLYPNGDVPTCQFSSRTVGNLRHQSFEDVWTGPAIARQRDWVRRCPGCWAECEVIPSAIYTGDLVKETLLPTASEL